MFSGTKVMILNTWTLSFHADWYIFHQHIRLILWHHHQTTSTTYVHKDTARVLHDTKGKERKHLLLLHWLFFVVFFGRTLTLSHSTHSQQRGVNFICTTTDFSNNHPTLPGVSFWITSKPSEQTLKAQNTFSISKTGVINFLHYLRMPVYVLPVQSSISANLILPVILFIFHSWHFIIIIFKRDLNPSRI